MDGKMNGSKGIWMDRWMDGCVHGWVHGWLAGYIQIAELILEYSPPIFPWQIYILLK